MRPFTTSQLAILASAYCVGTGRSLSWLGTAVLNNHKFFKLLSEGKTARSDHVERASQWFLDNWEDEIPWPEEVCRDFFRRIA